MVYIHNIILTVSNIMMKAHGIKAGSLDCTDKII